MSAKSGNNILLSDWDFFDREVEIGKYGKRIYTYLLNYHPDKLQELYMCKQPRKKLARFNAIVENRIKFVLEKNKSKDIHNLMKLENIEDNKLIVRIENSILTEMIEEFYDV